MGVAADQLEGERRQDRTILLVEDDALLRISIADHLRSKGYHVIEAGTVIEAATVLSSGASVHVIFSDVDLPGATGGLSFAVWVHAHYPGIPVILTSGVRAVMPTLNTQESVRFVPKPYDFDKVAHLIAGAIADASCSREGKSG
jgi:DNA-binding NtrC family response regulator